jgi:hypothetical protein
LIRCCGLFDGNRWWGFDDFDVNEWLSALEAMANYAKLWPNIIGIGLRNEVHSIWPSYFSSFDWRK